VTSILLDRVSVRFPLLGRAGATRRRFVGGRIGVHPGERPSITALEQISLRLGDGDRVGLIGHNGSGKSTLLRVLGGVYAPCDGHVAVRGRVLSLSEPMLGMSLECTGRENVVLRGIFIGLTPRQARARMDEIAAFAELEEWMEVPLKSWSTGMQLRLAFAIATAFDPDILLLDEQFATGDAAFLQKAERRLKSFVGRAGIVVHASHSERLIRETCAQVILLETGRMTAFGPAEAVFERYHEALERRAAVAP
jgi:ABC-2 type transport system ATP-binding protein/lipopolysaccharide transport system ATP-binding protein